MTSVAVLAACAVGGCLWFMANLLLYSGSQLFENQSCFHIEVMIRQYQIKIANGLSNMSCHVQKLANVLSNISEHVYKLENGLSGMRHDLTKSADGSS